MLLKLKVCSYCDHPPTDPQERSFDSFPIIVGRSTDCDYRLDDESRYISSNHAVILLEDGQLVLRDTSANGVYVNGAVEPVGREQTRVLTHENTLAIGDYILVLHIEHNSSAAPLDDPFALLDSSNSGRSPGQADMDYNPFGGDEPDWTPPSYQSGDAFADDGDIDNSPVSAHSGNMESNENDWADWVYDSSAGSIVDQADDAVQPHGSGSIAPEDDVDWFPGSSAETSPVPAPIPERGKPFRDNKPPPRQSRRSAESSAPPLRSVDAHAGVKRSAQRHRAPAPPSARRSDEVSASRQAGRSANSLNAMFRAASLRESDFAHLSDTEVLEQTGRLLTQMVDAMMVLLRSRTELKNAMRTDVTRLSSNNNNPLKFSVSTMDALTRLLVDDTQGYLRADSAVQEAVDDLKVHQLAMLEGMKSAVGSMLLQFDPDRLAKKLEKKGGLTANIPITREAKLWELFCEQYDVIHEEAVNDFGELFDAEFRKAYEKHIRKLGRNPDF